MELSKTKQVARRAWWLALVIVLLASCDQVTTGGPMDREAALKRSQLNLPLPISAHAVYYRIVDCGSQDQDLFVRFSGDPKDLESFVIDLFAKDKARRLRLGGSAFDPVIETTQEAMKQEPWGAFATSQSGGNQNASQKADTFGTAWRVRAARVFGSIKRKGSRTFRALI